jgi:hypothetical protein
MANTSPTPDEIYEAMKDYKCDVKVLDTPQTIGHQSGKTWKTTGLTNWGSDGPMVGVMMHHTAGVTPTKNNPIASLSWMKNAVIDGTNLVGAPACNQIIGGSPGSNYILCGRVSYHSGAGSAPFGLNLQANRANFRMWGIEMESKGQQKDLNDYQLEQAYRSIAALWDLCGWPESGNSIINHKDWTTRKPDTLYDRAFWIAGARTYLDGAPDTTEDGDAASSNKIISSNVKKISPDALGKSMVYGTPQTARFAVMNLTNETIFLSEGNETDLIDRTGDGLLYLSADVIEEGDAIEVSRNTNIKNATNDLNIQTVWVQDSETANSILNLISDSLDSQYKEIEIEIFANPLIQIGELVKINSKINKITFSQNDYFIVTRINHRFSGGGLNTTIAVKPIKETFKMI